MIRRCYAVVVVALGGAPALSAQDSVRTDGSGPRWVAATGSLSAMGEMYNRDGAGTAARPDQTGRLVANVTLSFANGLVTVPLTALISTDQVSFRQQINQLGISPKYRAVTFHLGHFTPAYSRYTFSDATLLGGGVEVRTRGVQFGVIGGRAQKAVRPTAFGQGAGQFDRWAFGGRVGAGNPDGSHVDAFLMVARDDDGSLDTAFVNNAALAPQGNAVLGMRGRLAVARRLSVEIEGATSQYEADVRASAPKTEGQAAAARLEYSPGTWSAGAAVEYLHAGFLTLGNSGLVGDRIDYTLNARAQLFGGRMSFTGSGGFRENNLSDDLEATSRQAIYALAATWQPVPAFGLDLQAANNVNDNKAKDDTSSIKNITGQYAVTTRLLWRTGSAQHLFVALGSHQQSENTSPASVALVDTRTLTLVGTWSMTFPSSLAFTATATRTEVELDTARVVITTVAPGIGRAFLQNRLQVSAQAQLTESRPVGGSASREVFPLLQLGYTVARGQSVQLRSSVRHHESPAGGTFDETVVTLQYTASWR